MTLSLTRREEEILFALADGLSGVEIADEFGTSIQTVRSQLKALYEKIRAKNAAHAVALAYHHGILQPKTLA